MKNKSPFLACLLILAIIIFAASCGGGGGGGGSMVSFGNNSRLHNGGDAGGWGNGGYNGNGFGGNGGGIGSGDEGEIIITGGTPLNVTKYVYNGTEYSDVTALTAALRASGELPDSFNIDFYVDSETTPRTARVTANGQANNGQDIFIEHQYKALFPASDGSSGTQEVLFYKRDGITLPGDPAGTVEGGFTFETNWNIGGSLYPCGSTIGVAASGDVDFSNASQVTAPYGFKEDGGDYILGFRSSPAPTGTIAINTNKVIKQVQLPASGDAVLDLSNVRFKNNEIKSSSWDGTAGTVKGVILPSTVTTIGNSAFQFLFGTSLETVTIPSSVTTIEEGAFKNLSVLKTVNFSGSGLTSIGKMAFSSCTALESFEMPNSVTTLGESAFYGCSDLATLTLSNHLTEIPNNAFWGCSSLDSTLDIPASVTTIGNSAFQDCTSIDAFTLHTGLTAIGDNAFQGCIDLDAVSIPNGVTTIGTAAFLSCSNLEQISIPPSVSSIGNSAFNGVKTDCVLTINNNGTPITLGGPLALPNSDYKVRLTGTGVPKKNVQDSIFDSDLYLTDVSITGSMTAISDFAFYGCTNLKNVELPSGIATIGEDAFFNCTRLETINIPASVGQIKTEAFKNAGRNAANILEITFASNQNMTQCYLPDKDFKVVLEGGVPICGGVSIFDDEDTLESVVFKGGTSIPSQAFSNCAALTEVTFNSYPTVIQTTPLPDNVHHIVFKSGLQPITNVANVGNLFPSTMNYSSLTVTFDNDSSNPGIRINEDAFNFTGANLITYTFAAHPNTNMTYDNGNCFPSGKTTVFSSTNFTWNAGTKSWQ
ncbi:MAG: leucine-rich repeat domain-containing protein [Spirochaetales bacterium]|nr:leucine-rich repeat domain-containing protein [Spirochaetales bacterium]